MKLKQTEAQIQREFWQMFQLCAGPDVVGFAVPNERIMGKDGGKSAGFLRKLRAQGMVPGAPDFVVMWHGGCCAIEFKSTIGRMSDSQKEMHRGFNRAKVWIDVCTSAEDAIASIRCAGAPLAYVIRDGKRVPLKGEAPGH